MADKFAANSQDGVQAVVDRLLLTIKPSGSALIRARDVASEHGLKTPVISDDWWLDVIEDAAYQDSRRFFFRFGPPISRGEQIAWWAMQKCWQEAAETERILQTTHPLRAWAFIDSTSGLREVCESDPVGLAEYMPQLTIPGFSGDFEDLFADMHARSRVEGMRRRRCNDPQGSGITVDGESPTCDDKLALRDPDFGFYEAADLACGFVQGFGAGLGPCVRGMPIIDYVVWFLSSASDWLPRRIHAYLLDGLKDWAVWPNWVDAENHDLGYRVDYDHSLLHALGTAPGVRAFKLVRSAETDLRDRIALSARLQEFPEDPCALVDRFLKEKFIERWFAAKTPRRVRHRRAVNSERKQGHHSAPQRR